MAYIRGFIHGAVTGTVIGLCVAPQTGDKTRAQLRSARDAAREGLVTTGRALRRVGPVASSAVHIVDRARHHGEATPHENGAVTSPRV